MKSSNVGHTLPNLRSVPRATLITASALLGIALAVASLVDSRSASASVITRSPLVAVVSGGMVRLGSGAASRAAPAMPAKVLPKCSRIEYRGNAGYIAVQENKNHALQWGIVMTPYKYSVGSWHVSTYLSGRKTSSGFNRTVKTSYTPHGSLRNVPSRRVFHVMAKVVNKYGTFVNVPNACSTI